MIIWIALLRGINVGGHHRLPMQDLRSILGGLGLQNAQTYIQSGNAVFLGPDEDPVLLGRKITDAIERQHGFAPYVLLIKKNTLDRAIANNPFTDQIKDNKHMQVSFYIGQPVKPDLIKLSDLASNGEVFLLDEHCFYLHAPAGIGRSKLAGKVEHALGVQTTARNWRSLLAIKALASTITAA